MKHRSGPVRTLTVLGLVALAATGCSSSSGGSAASTSTTAPAGGSSTSAASGSIFTPGDLASVLPDKYKKAGVIKVATDASYAPVDYYDTDNKTIIGLDVDIANKIGEKLGVKMEFSNLNFDSILPALAAGRYDMAMSAMTDTAEREKQVDFVDYFTAGTGILVKKGNPEAIHSSSDLCGKSVAVEKGTIQQTDQMPAASKQCKDKGKGEITIQPFPDQNGANLALSTGRADAVVADYPVVIYAADQSKGALEPTEANEASAPYGMAVPKASKDLVGALEAALREMMQEGTYQDVLEKWNVGAGGLNNVTINGAGGGN